MGYQSLRDCDSAYLTKWGNTLFATVALQIKQNDSAYLTKWGYSRFATVALQIKMLACHYHWPIKLLFYEMNNDHGKRDDVQ